MFSFGLLADFNGRLSCLALPAAGVGAFSGGPCGPEGCLGWGTALTAGGGVFCGSSAWGSEGSFLSGDWDSEGSLLLEGVLLSSTWDAEGSLGVS